MSLVEILTAFIRVQQTIAVQYSEYPDLTELKIRLTHFRYTA